MRAAVEIDDGVADIDGGAGHERIMERHGHDQDEDGRHHEQRRQAVPVAQQGQGFLAPESGQAVHRSVPQGATGEAHEDLFEVLPPDIQLMQRAAGGGQVVEQAGEG